MYKLKTGDEVIVIAGKDKGKVGKITRVVTKRKAGKRNPSKEFLKRTPFKVLVEGINLVKKHVKPNPNANQPGGILEKEAPLDISNVAIYNAAAKKADRVGFRILEDGKKVRYFKSNGELIDI